MVDTLNNITDLSLHVNGRVDTLIRDQAVCDQCHGASPEACTLCHGGTDNMTGAPPVGLRGETGTGQLAVGAHTIHLEGGSLADGFACETCHIVPTSLLSAGHYAPDSVAELTWSPLAGSSSAWERTTASCNDTYCHGNFRGGDAANVPTWTGSNQAACGSCHDVGTDPGSLRDRHFEHVSEENLDCYECPLHGGRRQQQHHRPGAACQRRQQRFDPSRWNLQRRVVFGSFRGDLSWT